MIDFSNLSFEVFQILRTYGKNIVLYDADGQRVFEPTDARRFYVIDDNILLSIVQDGDDSSIRVYLSDTIVLSSIQAFLETLRKLATSSNLLFHVKKFDREIKPQDFANKALEEQKREKDNMSMNIMEGLYGTSRSSYLKLENARMIVRHNARIHEQQIGSRGRNIQSIFVENSQGERVLFPVNMLSGARAMTQHVNQGGTFQDAVSQQIIRMAQDFKNLAQVSNYINVTGTKIKEASGIPGSHTIQAHGLLESKSGKSKVWEKTFKDQAAMQSWCNVNNATVNGSTMISGLDPITEGFNASVVSQLQGLRRQFDRITRPSTYVTESEALRNQASLMEGTEVDLTESVNELKEFLNFGDKYAHNFDEAVFESLARVMPMVEGSFFNPSTDRASTSVVNPGGGSVLPSSTPANSPSASQSQDPTKNPDDDEDSNAPPSTAGKDTGYTNGADTGTGEKDDDNTNESVIAEDDDEDFDDEDFDDEDDGDDEVEEAFVPGMGNNAVFKQFENWMNSFEPEEFLTGLSEAKETKYKITKKNFRKDREYHQEGTLAELIQAYSYTLDTGASYAHEKGNKKINTNPSNIKSLVANLNAAADNAAANGDSGVSYSFSVLPSAVEEGKSYKRNDDSDDDADSKKRQDKEQRDAAKKKKDRTDEGAVKDMITDLKEPGWYAFDMGKNVVEGPKASKSDINPEYLSDTDSYTVKYVGPDDLTESSSDHANMYFTLDEGNNELGIFKVKAEHANFVEFEGETSMLGEEWEGPFDASELSSIVSEFVMGNGGDDRIVKHYLHIIQEAQAITVNAPTSIWDLPDTNQIDINMWDIKDLKKSLVSESSEYGDSGWYLVSNGVADGPYPSQSSAEDVRKNVQELVKFGRINDHGKFIAQAAAVEEGKSYKRNGDDSDDSDVMQKRKEDKQKREEKKQRPGQEPVEEGLSKFMNKKSKDKDAHTSDAEWEKMYKDRVAKTKGPIVKEGPTSGAEQLAAPVIKALQDIGAEVETRMNDQGQVEVMIKTGNAPHDPSNPYVLSAQNIGKAIDKFYREYRAAGHTFTQPVGGKFVIGESEQLDELAPTGKPVSELKSELMQAKAALGKMSPFDSSYGPTRSKIERLEKEIKANAPYGKEVEETARVGSKTYQQAARISRSNIDRSAEEKRAARRLKQDADEAQIKADLRKKGIEEGFDQLMEFGPSIFELKSDLNHAKAAFEKMSPFDPKYRETKGKIEHLESEISKNSSYGKGVTESTDGTKCAHLNDMDTWLSHADTMGYTYTDSEEGYTARNKEGKIVGVFDANDSHGWLDVSEAMFKVVAEDIKLDEFQHERKSVNELKSELIMLKSKFNKMTGFDRDYGTTKLEIERLQKAIAAEASYGKQDSEETSESVVAEDFSTMQEEPESVSTGAFETSVDIHRDGGVQRGVEVKVEYKYMPDSNDNTGMSSPNTYDGLAAIKIIQVRALDTGEDVYDILDSGVQEQLKEFCLEDHMEHEQNPEMAEACDSEEEKTRIPRDMGRSFKQEVLTNPKDADAPGYYESAMDELRGRMVQLAGIKK